MKRLFYFTAICAIVGSLSGMRCQAQEMTDDEIMAEFRAHPYKSGACHSPYYAPDVRYTPAPKGYKAFYISHIGRHGSRYQTRGYEVFDGIVALLDSLHLAQALTPQGDSLRLELYQMQQVHNEMNGMLTNRGSAEHTGIAKRLADRCPSVFRQKDRKIVSCNSTLVQRTIQSMAGFVAGLDGAGKDLDFKIGCGFDFVSFYDPGAKHSNGKLRDSLIVAEEALMNPDIQKLKGLQSRLFKGYEASLDNLYRLFVASISAGCLDMDINPVRFFTTEELFEFYKKRDVSFSAKYGTFAPVRSETAKNGRNYLRLIVDEADNALDGNGHCADLRFAHDGNVGPLMNLLGIGGYSISAHEDAPYRYWQSFNQICMASNLQLEFYKNSKSDILVKALFNEKEVKFPGLNAIDGVYYKWNDVRRYMISKCEDVREVPDYYADHLKEKAEEIRQLQKEELDGFYFITDMHFPINFGNAAALIESLENSTDKRLITYGGDAITYLNYIGEGMGMQISALEQMRGVSPILWTRGNHDIVNYTGKKDWITREREPLPAWESSNILGRFRPQSAVSNEADPYTTYCYYDSPGKKVRYVVFDTTDSIQDNKMMGGLSDNQLRWIIEKAILDAPKGYGIVFISHIPFLGEKVGCPAADALSAFSDHSTFSLGEITYDFSTRQDVRMICVVCGHRHRDYSFNFPGGQAQINVAADCNYRKKKPGTIDEQCFDYISIGKDGTIRTVRIGEGKNRQF